MFEALQDWFSDACRSVFLGGFKFIKYIVFCANLVVLIFGIILIAVPASTMYSDNQDYKKIASFSLGTGLIVLGVFLLLIAFFGCCGAAWENRLLLACYFVFLLIILISEIGIGIGASVYKNNLPSTARKAWTKVTNSSRTITQNNMDCCGWDNSTDNPELPCPEPKQGEVLEGCGEIIINALTKEAHTVEIVGIVLGCLELLVLFLSCCLYCSIPSKKETEKSYLSEFAKSPGLANSRKYDQI